MGCEVYANSDEISCKAGDGKVIAAFPDVCLTPPSPPAGPIPVPYPDTSFSKDMQNGSKSVKIKGKEVMLKDKSFYKTSPLGDEAATRGLGAGVITHVITGKTYFIAWSMDVKIEGNNVDRNLDFTTSNHASPIANAAAPFTNLSGKALTRASHNRCPCCNSEDCPAAFQDGETPITAEEYYGVTKGGNDPRSRRYREMIEQKKNNCTCDGKVFPEDPCNVFRRDFDRGAVSEAAWRSKGHPEQFADDWRADKGKKGPGSINKFIKDNPNEPKPPVNGTFNQVNHLTPLSAGGCPTSPNNLQPHDLLCATCKAIDGTFTDWQRR